MGVREGDRQTQANEDGKSASQRLANKPLRDDMRRCLRRRNTTLSLSLADAAEHFRTGPRALFRQIPNTLIPEHC